MNFVWECTWTQFWCDRTFYADFINNTTTLFSGICVSIHKVAANTCMSLLLSELKLQSLFIVWLIKRINKKLTSDLPSYLTDKYRTCKYEPDMNSLLSSQSYDHSLSSLRKCNRGKLLFMIGNATSMQVATSFYSPSMNVAHENFLPLLKRLDDCIS